MKSLSATSARRRFGQLLNAAQSGPIRIMRRSSDVAIVMSPEKYRRLVEAARGKVNPTVERLHAESAKRWASVYAALAR